MKLNFFLRFKSAIKNGESDSVIDPVVTPTRIWNLIQNCGQSGCANREKFRLSL